MNFTFCWRQFFNFKDMSEDPNKRSEQSFLNMTNSRNRMDILIISVSGGGVYVCLEAIKFLHEQNLEVSNIPKVAGALFVIAVLVNFLSQYYSYKSNYHDYLESQYKIAKRPEDAAKEDLLSEQFDKKVTLTNKISTWSMVIALLVLCAFFFTSI